MKRYMHIPTIITVALIVVLAVGGILLWSGLNDGSGTQAEGTTESTTPTTAPAPVEDYSNLMLDDYDLPIDNTTINDETIYQILSHVDQIFSQYKTITIKKTIYHFLYFSWLIDDISDYVTIEDTLISINAEKYMQTTTPSQTPTVHYLVALSLISNEYAHCIAEFDFDGHGMNRIHHPSLIICPRYSEAGYETAQDFYDAVWKKECPQLPDMYKVGIRRPGINNLNPQTFDEISFCYYENYLNNQALS